VPSTTATTPFEAYADLSPNTGEPLTRGKPTPDWFGSGPADAYVQQLLERFANRHADAATELAWIANEAKWSVGWKSFGRWILEVLG
jgi:hypothetical protein